jgi:fucose 4-O-acetylase-like acetyltransferase
MANCEQISIGGGRDKPQTQKVRDERIDSVKYCLIVVVIAGHVIEYSETTVSIIVWKWIYIFHMPLFIFISGYFSRKKDKELWPSIWKLLEPLIVFQTVAIITKLINGGETSFRDILTPWYVLWYLLSLIYWRLMLQVIPESILRNAKLILPTAFGISILTGFLPIDNFLSLHRTFAFMPFFFLGYCMRGKNLFLPKKYQPLCFMFLILMVAVPLYYPQYLGILTHSIPFGSIYDGGFYNAAKRMIVFSLAIPMSIAFINVCPNKPWIARQGRLTMQYFIYHALAIIPLIVITMELNIPMSFVTATIYIIVLTVGIGMASRLPYFTKFTNPSSFLKSPLKK